MVDFLNRIDGGINHRKTQCAVETGHSFWDGGSI